MPIVHFPVLCFSGLAGRGMTYVILQPYCHLPDIGNKPWEVASAVALTRVQTLCGRKDTLCSLAISCVLGYHSRPVLWSLLCFFSWFQTHYCWFLTTSNLSICYKSLQYVYIVVLLVQKKYFYIILSHVCWGSFSKGMNFLMQLLRIFRSENLNWVLWYSSEKQENHKSKIV